MTTPTMRPPAPPTPQPRAAVPPRAPTPPPPPTPHTMSDLPTGPGINLQKTLIVVAAVAVLIADFWHHAFNITASFGFQPGPAGGEGPFLVVLIACVLLLLFLNKAWVYLVAGIGVSLLPVFVIVFVQFVFGAGVDWVALKKGADFGVIWLLTMALLLALPAGIIGFNRRRKHRPMRSTLRSKQAITAMVVSAFCLAMALTGSLAASAAAGGAAGGYDFPVGQSTSITTESATFTPNHLTIASGEIAEIVAQNKDNELHTFTYMKDGVEYSHDLLGGSTTKFLVKFDAPGEIKFRCKPHSSGYDDPTGMTGTITVT